jgi:hypothetical protein
MFVARWSVDVRFGHREEFLRLQKKWLDEVGSKAGFDKAAARVLNGSIGAAESRWEMEMKVASLDALEKHWERMKSVPYHAQFARELEPHIVSGSNRWEILRIVDV